jgi:hypothetical protein
MPVWQRRRLRGPRVAGQIAASHERVDEAPKPWQEERAAWERWKRLVQTGAPELRVEREATPEFGILNYIPAR